jgi:outer membrane lipoprotein carrier protein
MKRTAGIALSILVAAAFLAAAAPQAAPKDMVARLERTLRSLTAFQADFTQTSSSSSVSTPLMESGRLYVKKDDLMRWDYTAPEKKTFVFKGGLFLSYFPEDNQLWRQRVPPEEYEGDIPAILLGKARLAERYDVESSPFPGASPNAPQLRLTPKAEGDGSFILIEVDPGNGMLRRAILFDWAGNKTEFVFTRFKADPRLPADLFELKVPPDCEIIDGERPRKK